MTNLKKHIEYSKDPILFAKECWLTFDAFDKFGCKIIEPFDYQLNLINQFHRIPFNIVAKSRQMHLSSTVALYIAWYVIFNSTKTVGIIGTSSESSKRILDHVRIILQYYSVDNVFHWEDDFTKNSKTEIRLKNGCIIKAMPAFADAARGMSYDFLYIDEAAFLKHYEEIFASSLPAISCIAKPKMIIGSTPQDNSIFNKHFLEASVKNNFNPILLHWATHPKYSEGLTKNHDSFIPSEYTSPWFENTIKILNYNNSSIEQEIECIVRYKEQSNKTKTISLRLEEDLYKKIKNSIGNKTKVSDYIRNLIERDLDSRV